MYGKYAGILNEGMNTANDIKTTIDGIDFESCWSSEASTVLLDVLNTNLNSINTLKAQLDLFETILYLVDEYIIIVEKIAKLQQQLNAIKGSDDEELQALIAQLMAQIAELEQKRLELRDNILGLLASITGIEVSELPQVSYSNADGFEYICDLNLLENNLSRLGDCQSIASRLDGNNPMGLSGMDYVNYKLDSVCERYSGREATVNSILMSLQLSVEAGARIRYYNPGQNISSIPYNTNEQLVDGMDCCSYVSWAVNKGTAEPFHWESVGGFMDVGEQIDLSSALPGDVLAKGNLDGSRAHVVMVIENNPETGIIKIAESAGGVGSRLITKTYKDIENIKNPPFNVYSLEKYYTGELSNA